MRSWILAALLLCMAGQAQAQQVHKCRDARGQVSYLSWPCPAGSRTLRVVDAPPEPEPPVRPVTLTQPAPGRPRKTASRARTTRVASARPRPDACVQAKAWRDRQLQALGLRRTFDDLRRTQDRVWAACKGR